MSSSYSRSASDGATVHCCPVCLRVELNSYEGWLWHLGSREHQINNSRSNEPFFDPKGSKRSDVLSRCVDVHGILGLKARELLNYFKTWGEIEDFSYWYKNEGEDGKAVRCVCLYKDRESAEACIDEEQHELEGKKLKVDPYKSYAHRDRRGDDDWKKEERRRGGSGGDYNRRGGSDGGGYSDRRSGNGGEGYSNKRKSEDRGSLGGAAFKSARFSDK